MNQRLLRGRATGIRWASLLALGLLLAPFTLLAAPSTATATIPATATVPTPVPTNLNGPGTQIGSAPAPLGARTGPSNPQQSMTIAVSLKVQDQRALDAFLKDLYTPTAPNYKHYLSPADFSKRFFSATGRQQVADFLHAAKLSVVDRGIGSIVNATGTVDQLQAAFKITISDYQDGSGTVYAAADVAPTVPTTIAPFIQSIVGLDSAIQIKTHMAPAPEPAPQIESNDVAPAGTPATPPPGASGCDAALNVAANYGAYTPNQLAAAYNFSSFATKNEQGQGQIVALMEVDDYRDVNVAAYQNCFHTAVPITRVPVDGGTHPGAFQQEVELDMDAIIGMVPKIQQLLVYESDYRIVAMIDAFQMAANDNIASVISISFGGCEQARALQTFIMPENTIFEQMAAQGQSVFAASGDSGSRDCNLFRTPTGGNLSVDDPASQPYVTGVGGTRLTIDPKTNAYVSETVWNGFGTGSGAGGGGLSTIWPAPEYQNAPGTQNAYNNGKRQVPDVSANADPKAGFIIYTTDPQTRPRVTSSTASSCFMATGGTSVAAPIWAAAATLTNQRLTNAGYPKLGFANPLIYRLAQTNPAVFHDVTTGHNCYDASCDGTIDPRYPATVGYDLATGIGTFDASAFGDAVLGNLPHITGTTPTTGSDSGGTLVTFTGANFQQGATVSFGGIPATNVRVVDDKTITAVTPPKPVGAVDIEIVTGGIRFSLPAAYTYSAQAAPLAPSSPVPTSSSPSPATASPTPKSAPAAPAPTAIATPTPKKFKVANTDGEGANLRDKPDMKTGKVVTIVVEGTDVQVTGPAVDADSGSWYPVQVAGKSGFMRAEYLSAVSG